jgi:hypothetical protein
VDATSTKPNLLPGRPRISHFRPPYQKDGSVSCCGAAELSLDPLPHQATASCSVFDVLPHKKEVRQLFKVLSNQLHQLPDNRTAPC